MRCHQEERVACPREKEENSVRGKREERRGGLASLGLDQSKEKRERSKPISRKYISWAAIS